jgi:hypothetical protein
VKDDSTAKKNDTPNAEAGAKPTAPPYKAQMVVRALPPPNRWDRTPVYRVVEIIRDSNGRLRQEGRVWHTDLDRLRKFGRAVASNSSSHRVLIADASGDVLEELSVLPLEHANPCWNGWKNIPLPPAPPRMKRRQRRPEATLLTPTPNPFEVVDTAALKETLVAAAETRGEVLVPVPVLVPVAHTPVAMPTLSGADEVKADAVPAGQVTEVPAEDLGLFPAGTFSGTFSGAI